MLRSAAGTRWQNMVKTKCLLNYMLIPSAPPFSKPFATDPTIEEVRAGLGLVKRHHVPRRMDLHKRQVAVALHRSNRLPFATELQTAKLNLIE